MFNAKSKNGSQKQITSSLTPGPNFCSPLPDSVPNQAGKGGLRCRIFMSSQRPANVEPTSRRMTSLVSFNALQLEAFLPNKNRPVFDRCVNNCQVSGT
ncbi:MAG: hypothetical protein MI861_29085, partial [Pirellulales bacterium]|nr:hypothetical protein [Pirellulales bacterium]